MYESIRKGKRSRDNTKTIVGDKLETCLIAPRIYGTPCIPAPGQSIPLERSDVTSLSDTHYAVLADFNCKLFFLRLKKKTYRAGKYRYDRS